MAADDNTTSAGRFDNWYAAMPTSSRRDEIVQRHLGLPAAVLSSSLLPWDGIAEVVDRLRLRAPATLVDMGCGRGGYGLEVADRASASLIGIDFSTEAIRQARRYAVALDRQARFVVADIAASGLPDASVDGVMCIDTMPFVDDPAAVFAEMRRVLRSGGRAVITTWEAVDRDDETMPDGMRRVDCAAGFAAAGFTDIAVVQRRAWIDSERALWLEAAALDPAGDEALASLHEEAVTVLPQLERARRLLASGTAPGGGASAS
jgi:SAM-dependent methyltransferase